MCMFIVFYVFKFKARQCMTLFILLVFALCRKFKSKGQFVVRAVVAFEAFALL